MLTIWYLYTCVKYLIILFLLFYGTLNRRLFGIFVEISISDLRTSDGAE